MACWRVGTERPRDAWAPASRRRLPGLLLMALAQLVALASAAAGPVPPAVAGLPARAASAPAEARPGVPGRPRIALVLSGGGARGLAHIGVLKVLERARVPVDLIVGTSMGAIIGGLYASGMEASAIDAEIRRVDWDGLFANRVARPELPLRQKEDDYAVTPALEVGLRDGELRVPLGTVSTRGLELLLRRYTLPVAELRDFDRLPIPFRAVATDMETGQPEILAHGDLALAMRSSMSVPGVFAPTDVGGRLLGDGGLVDNLPVAVARSLGAERIIAVNIGTPLQPRESLDTLLGVTAQMINILTEQNVQRSLARLDAQRDLLIAPDLGRLTAADFQEAAAFIALGEDQAAQQWPALRALALPEADYRAWRAARGDFSTPRSALARVGFSGSDQTRPERYAGLLESQAGERFDVAAAERDVRRLAAAGDYTRVDYQLLPGADGDSLIFSVEEKTWGPNFFRVGLDFSTDFSGRGGFNVKLLHHRPWLDEAGLSWRNLVQIGTEPGWTSELRRPLGELASPLGGWFAALAGELGREEVLTYAGAEGGETGRIRRTRSRLGLDLGQPLGTLGELRLGAYSERWRDRVVVASEAFDGLRGGITRRERGLRLRLAFDRLDFASFPQAGWRARLELAAGALDDQASTDRRQSFTRIEAEGTQAWTLGRRHVLTLSGRLLASGHGRNTGQGLDALGGFQQLSGYKPGQIDGNQILFGRAVYYARLSPTALTRGLFAGASAELGNAWRRREDIRLGDLRSGFSVFLGADTGLGPLYLGLVHAPRGDTGLVLRLGAP